MTPQVHRCIRCFQKDNDDFVKEIPLETVTLAELQRIFHVPHEDPMYDCYLIENEHLPQLKPFVPETIELGRFDYFVECDALPDSGD